MTKPQTAQAKVQTKLPPKGKAQTKGKLNKEPKVKIGKITPLPRTEWGLQEILKRYYVPGISAVIPGYPKKTCRGDIQHHADCAIFRSLQRYEFSFCSCGLMHDLEKHLSGTDLIDVLYPRYWHDYYLQECGEDTDDETPEVKVSKQEERDACERILLEIFGTPTYKTLTDIKNQHEEDKELLAKVFGEKFPKVFFRLEQRLVKEIDDYRKYESYKRGSCSSSS